MPFARNGDVALWFDVAGDGDPLLLIHGRMSDQSAWSKFGYVEALRGYRLVLMDVRGHGESDKPHDRADYTAELLAADALAVLNAAGIDGASAVFGYSMGGRVAYNLAAHHPDRVAALVVGGAGPFGPAVDRAEELKLAETLEGGIDAYIKAIATMLGVDEVPEAVQTELRKNDIVALASLARASADWQPVVDTLRLWNGPILLFGGTADPIWPHIQRAHAELPCSDLHALDGLGHGDVWMRSDLIAPIIGSFLEGCRSARWTIDRHRARPGPSVQGLPDESELPGGSARP